MNDAQSNNAVVKALEKLRLRLLDLTARNRLINFRHTKKGSLRIIDELPGQLVEMLLAESEMRFLPIAEPTPDELVTAGYIKIDRITGQETRLRKHPTADEWASQLEMDTSYEVPTPSGETTDDRHADRAIQTMLYPYELEAHLKNLMQTSESAIQEMGTNILYLAFGFLEWSENSNSDSRIAPLFLVPVRLRKGRLNAKTKTYEYTISYSGEEIIPNLSLREKLRVDFAMALPDLDETTDPEAYFSDVQEMIRQSQPRWQLRRFTTLTLLNFSKLLMYLDLNPARWPAGKSIVDHPVVMQFLAGYGIPQDEEEQSNGDLGFGEEYPIDEIENIHTKYPLIDDADSSQHSALIDAIDGKNLVIEGPPGTGKSQTITNLIAAAMAQGKRVLFVAEKLAALEVVRRRLDAAGLGEFCLELHSHKSQKQKIIEEIGSRLSKHGHYRMPSEIEVDIIRYEELKTDLKNYVERINHSWKNTGKTLHQIFMAATRYREVISVNPDTLHPEGYDGDNWDVITQRRMEDQIDAFRTVYRAVARQLNGDADLHKHPWYGVRNTDLQMFDLERVHLVLANWQNALRSLNEERLQIAQYLGCEPDAIADSLQGDIAYIEDFERMPALTGDELLDALPTLRNGILNKAQKFLQLFEDTQTLYKTLAKKVGPDILYDLSPVDSFLAASEHLCRIVNQEVSLGALFKAIDNLKEIQNQTAALAEPLKEIRATVGENAASYLVPTEAGLTEFRNFVDLVASLNTAYGSLRHERFDNDELDILLPKLRAELEQLRSLHNELQGTFRLDTLPNQTELSEIQKILISGGAFRWFKVGWRAARTQLIGLAASSQTKFAKLHPLLEKAEKYSRMRQELDENWRYKEALGEHLRGLDTDLTALESMRDWYKRVRQEYGMGFGPKVALGNAILGLPTEIARSVRFLVGQGLPKQLNDLLETFTHIKQIFAPIPELQNDRTLLTGEDDTISRLLVSLNDALGLCKPLLTDKTISIAELVDRVQLLDSLKKSVILWEATNYDNKLFHGRLGLKLGVYADNAVALSRLHKTLDIAVCVEQQLTNDDVRRRIYDQPEPATFRKLASHATQIRDHMETQEAKRKAFAELVQLEIDDWTRFSGNKLDEVLARNDRALQNNATLQNWLEYVRVREQVAAMGLTQLVAAVERGDVEIEQVDKAYKAGIFDLLAREILRDQPELGRFSGLSQEAQRVKFREYDNRLKKLQREKIACQVDRTKIPQGYHGARVTEHTDLYLLQHECSKRKRHLPIRQLLHRAGGALIALKPCFMMGPMSVAQYLAPGQIKFDLIVMDEASQIKPQDALGAIARGTQLVVVGDPKQLPPTSFFDRVVDEESEDTTAIEESESILDATLPMFPARRLRWHYRSQHESLIAFSNHSFYNSDLVLFPSPNKKTDSYGIRYSRVPRGCFVNRRNAEEAEIIAEAVREHFRHQPQESLGVVAMSAEQRTQIENALEMLSKEDSAFQMWLEKDSLREEPLFIKNLENVQGDERDVIFISLTYGPQEPGGKVFQRFGPINSEMGWRRLNVLFTRSKKRMHIFSSMGSDDIIVNSTGRQGVQALRDFLAFCETGILHKTESETGRVPDSDFEIAVMEALRNQGFACVPQVGVTGFFIDVAVVDPGNPGRYLMGIECDGATYHSAKSTRDRDRLRQAILERLGWQIRRIWSTDWFKNPQAQLQPIIRELNALKTQRPDGVTQVIESESEEIEEIIERFAETVPVGEEFLRKKMGLREKLIAYDGEVIRRELPNKSEYQRLLRPAMMEALLEYRPTNRAEFLEYIPGYLRQSTSADEAEYLDDVLKIINASADESIGS